MKALLVATPTEQILSTRHILALMTFAAGWYLAFHWYTLDFFITYDVLFDSDPNTNLLVFSDGIHSRHSLTHPLIEIIAIPVRLLAWCLTVVGLSASEEDMRVILGLAVSPLVSAMSIVVFHKLLTVLLSDKTLVNGITLIYALSFSNVVFAIIPETYALSNLFITISLYLLVRTIDGRPVSRTTWFVLGCVIYGITITNLIIHSGLYLLSLYHTAKLQANTETASWRVSGSCMWRAATDAVGIVICVMLVFIGSRFIFEVGVNPEIGPAWVERFSADTLMQNAINALNVLSASIYSVINIGYYPVENPRCPEVMRACNSILTQRNTLTPFVIWLPVMLLGVLYYGVISLNNTRPHMPLVLTACGGILLFNLLLHSEFGIESFLYTQHWISALFILLIPLLSAHKAVVPVVIIVQLISLGYFFFSVESLVQMNVVLEVGAGHE